MASESSPAVCLYCDATYEGGSNAPHAGLDLCRPCYFRPPVHRHARAVKEGAYAENALCSNCRFCAAAVGTLCVLCEKHRAAFDARYVPCCNVFAGPPRLCFNCRGEFASGMIFCPACEDHWEAFRRRSRAVFGPSLGWHSRMGDACLRDAQVLRDDKLEEQLLVCPGCYPLVDNQGNVVGNSGGGIYLSGPANPSSVDVNPFDVSKVADLLSGDLTIKVSAIPFDEDLPAPNWVI